MKTVFRPIVHIEIRTERWYILAFIKCELFQNLDWVVISMSIPCSAVERIIKDVSTAHSIDAVKSPDLGAPAVRL